MFQITPEYYDSIVVSELPTQVTINDHLGGFDSAYRNAILDKIQNEMMDNSITIFSEYVFDNRVTNNYPKLKFAFDFDKHVQLSFLEDFSEYIPSVPLNFKNFICSFNGNEHISRQLLVSIIEKFGWFDEDYVSKNFTFPESSLDGNIRKFVGNRERFYRKFFTNKDNEQFFQTVNSFGHVRIDHAKNIYILESKLRESFLHIVSETMSTSYYPFINEKFLYSIVTKGLFLAYGQPGWHDHLERYYGFKKYTQLFDYRFDTIENPVERLVELMSMISKFSHLTVDEWYDLYRLEHDTIEYNYDHYYSKRYLTCLKENSIE